MSQKIRIKLKSYDYSLVDKSAEKIVKTVKATGAIVSGPIPLPTHKRIFTVNRSTFVNKKSREQFELSSYKRLIDIYSSTAKTVDALMKLELPSGVEVETQLYSFVAIFLQSLDLCNHTRTHFDNSAWKIFSLGTENGCHSDFFS